MYVLVSFVKDDYKSIVEASEIRCFDANNYDKKKKYRVYHDKENYYADAFIVGMSDDWDALEKQKSKRFSRPSLICAKSASESSDIESNNTDRNNNNSKVYKQMISSMSGT